MPKVKVIGAYVNNVGPGAITSLSEAEAAYYEKIGYVERVVEAPEQKQAPKRAPKAKQPKDE